MSNAICNPECPTGSFTTYTVSCVTEDYLRDGGFSHLLMLDCEAVINSMSSTQEWEDLKNSGQLFVTPSGIGKLLDPETAETVIDLCRPAITTKTTLNLEWETFYLDNVSYTDNVLLKELKTKQGNKTLMLFRCIDNVLLIDDGWSAGLNPGFGGFSLKPKRVSEQDKAESIFVTGQINAGINKDWKYVKLTDAVVHDIFEPPSP